MRVLIADDDPDFCAFALQALEGTEFEADDISADPTAAVVANAILILDEAACERRFAEGPHADQLVVASVPDGDVHALDRALLRGADDAFYKPIAPRALIARLTVAGHRLVTSPRAARSPRTCLEETLAAGTTGTLVIRGALHSGAIHVHDGGIAWVESAGRDVSLGVLLGRFGVSLDPDTALAVIAEARQTGQHFTEVLAEWGLVDRATARECLRSHLADEVATLLSDLNASALFMPYDRRRASSLSFSPADVLPTAALESGVVPASGSGTTRSQPTVPGLSMAALRGAIELTGCKAVMLMDRAGGRLAAVGSAIDNDFAWSLVHAMKASQQLLTVEEGALAYIARATDERRVLVAAFSLRDVSLGLARTSLNACCKRAAEGFPGFERSAS